MSLLRRDFSRDGSCIGYGGVVAVAVLPRAARLALRTGYNGVLFLFLLGVRESGCMNGKSREMNMSNVVCWVRFLAVSQSVFGNAEKRLLSLVL